MTTLTNSKPDPIKNRIVFVLLLGFSLLAAACSSGGMEVAPGIGDGPATGGIQGAHDTNAADSTDCTESETRICHNYMPVHNGVRQCLVGYQVCTNSAWGPCLEGVPENEEAP
ncbi:MAG TPA: hypothetical protein VL137_07675 [Polyangiaceae bacterium]|nr:hypothetical protein [Polyangiaceae bacterium]